MKNKSRQNKQKQKLNAETTFASSPIEPIETPNKSQTRDRKRGFNRKMSDDEFQDAIDQQSNSAAAVSAREESQVGQVSDGQSIGGNSTGKKKKKNKKKQTNEKQDNGAGADKENENSKDQEENDDGNVPTKAESESASESSSEGKESTQHDTAMIVKDGEPVKAAPLATDTDASSDQVESEDQKLDPEGKQMEQTPVGETIIEPIRPKDTELENNPEEITSPTMEPPLSKSTEFEESINYEEELQKQDQSLNDKISQLQLLEDPTLEDSNHKDPSKEAPQNEPKPPTPTTKRATAPDLPDRNISSIPPPSLPPRSSTEPNHNNNDTTGSPHPPLPPRHSKFVNSPPNGSPLLPDRSLPSSSRKNTLSPEDFQPPPLPPQLTASQRAKHQSASTGFGGIGSWFQRSSTSSKASINSEDVEKLSDYDENYDLLLSRLNVNNEELQLKDENSKELINTSINSLRTSFAEKLPISQGNTDQDDVHSKVGDDIDWPFWTKVVNDYSQVVKTEPSKLSKEISKGIPDSIRGIVWQLVSGSNSIEFVDKYNELKEQDSSFEKSIQKDLSRTSYTSDYGIDQESLYRVIRAYSNLDTEVGYTQGMAFITVPLLLKLNELESFSLLHKLMTGYGVRTLYLPEMHGLLLILYQFDRLVEDQLPNLHNHFLREGVRSSMYATQWFLTFFAYKFPLEFVLRIYDIIITEGYESLLKFAIALVKKNEDTLLNLKFDQLLEYLKEGLFNAYVENDDEDDEEESEEDGGVSKLNLGDIFKKPQSKPITVETYNVDQLVEDATNVKIIPMTLKRYQTEHEEIHRLEKERQEEVDQLKLRNTQLRKEIKKVESSYTILNREHVQIANEMIQGRVKIGTLEDEIKDLREQNGNLRERIKILQKPNEDTPVPSNLEEDLKITMERNLEVMTKNQELEDQVGSLLQQVEELKAQLTAQQEDTVDPHAKPMSPSKGHGWKLFK